jgi:hypothetical protein
MLYDIPIWDVHRCRCSLVLFLGTFGFVTLGTFYAAMASRLRAREVLLPLLLFPDAGSRCCSRRAGDGRSWPVTWWSWAAERFSGSGCSSCST